MAEANPFRARCGARQNADVRLEGWNHIPRGYGATFDLDGAPRWLRVLFITPFVDRFAYPVLVRRGHGWLTRHPGWPAQGCGPVTGGWQLRPDDYQPPASPLFDRR
ncbi:MAG TPA: hypothetical protein VNE21_06190 [Mycobacteriales bacterium]|nr:hypothetical protein [Mycobacteriales bacterium]